MDHATPHVLINSHNMGSYLKQKNKSLIILSLMISVNSKRKIDFYPKLNSLILNTHS